jgi:hypothetical protein
MQVVYGETMQMMPLGEHRPGPELPAPDFLTPRQRRTIVCAHLSVNGEHWELEEAQRLMKPELRGDKADIRCERRAGIQIAADYALDVCLSSWCRVCPFVAPS